MVGINPSLFFKVEAFTATESFAPTKPYASRIKWSDPNGNEQSKLLLIAPADFIHQVVRGDAAVPPPGQTPDRPSNARPRRKNGRRLEAARD